MYGDSVSAQGMHVFAELEFRIAKCAEPTAGYPVSPRLCVNGQDQFFSDDVLKIDLEELHNLRGEFDKYESRLSEFVFQSPIVKDALDKARAQLDQAGMGNMLRIRLVIDKGAQELQHVRWECLRDPDGSALFNGDTILFSRYLSSPNLRPLTAKAEPRALIVIANPSHLDQAINPEDPQNGLAPVDVKGEKLRAETGLKGAGFAVNTLASPPDGTVPASLDNILSELEQGYDILYLVCHGGLVSLNGTLTPMLWLEGSEDPIDGTRLVEGIRNMGKQPRLVILASCQSAGTDGASVAASGTLGALGPLLATAGVPAVIAMQGNIKMSTIQRFMPQFLAELAKDGHIDRAMGKARGHVLDCNDFWMPALFMRLSDGLIWSQAPAAAAPDPEAEIKQRIRNIFSDLSVSSAILPLSEVIGPGDLDQPGEIKPDAPGAWKTVVPAPNLLPYAILRVFGAGRVLALSHDQMAVYQNAEGKNHFLDEGVAWLKGAAEANVILSAKATDTLSKFRTNLFNLPVLENEFASRGFHVDTLTDFSDSAALAKASLLVIVNSWGKFKPEEIEAITNFVKAGGALLAVGIGWSWKKPLDKYPMNQLLKSFGASWTAN